MRHFSINKCILKENIQYFMMVTNKMEDVHKNLFLAKKHPFWAQKGPFWAMRAIKLPAGRPNDHISENRRYPELPQDMGDL